MATFPNSILQPISPNRLATTLNAISNTFPCHYASFTNATVTHSQIFLKLSVNSYRITSRGGFIREEEDEDEESCSFHDAVSLFNKRDYYKCHDILEELWNDSQEPTRTLVHGILQCAVGFHHLFNQQLLGEYAAGELLYYLELDRNWNAFIVFSPEKYRGKQVEPPMIKIPILEASEHHIMDLEYT